MKKLVLQNQVAVITGGLGGLGRAVAKKLLSAGATVVLINKGKASGRELQNYFHSAKVHYFFGSVEDIQQISALFAKIHKKFKRLDVLVNCAGVIGPIGPLHTNPNANWQETLKINLFGTVNACHAALPIMLRKKRGKIVNFAGGGAVQAFPNFSAYASSKAGVVRFTENLAKEYENNNIQVNSIAPGMINTNLVKELLKAGQKKVGAEYFNKTLKQSRQGGDDPEAAGDLVLFLVSPANKLTGKLISAKWDNWKKFNPALVKKINNNGEYTLRRIDNKYFYEK